MVAASLVEGHSMKIDDILTLGMNALRRDALYSAIPETRVAAVEALCDWITDLQKENDELRVKLWKGRRRW